MGELDSVLDDFDRKYIAQCRAPLSAAHYKKPYNALRRDKLMMFSALLSEHDDFVQLPLRQKLLIITELEKGCKNCSVDKARERNIMTTWKNDLFCDVYHTYCYLVSANVEKYGFVGNPHLVKNILNHHFDARQVAYISSVDMYPTKHTHTTTQIALRKLVEQNIKTTSLYVCSKCREKKCTIENLYNRSLDEGVNLRLTCVNCNHEFNA